MGYYCTVPQCTSLAGKTKNVKFHRFPRDVTMADKWNIILKRGKPYTKYSKVCSLHFTQGDYNVTTMGQWKTLSKDAVPSQNLPKCHADGTVMVIRKSRTVKYRDGRKESVGDKCDKWSVPAQMQTPTSEMSPVDPQNSNIAYRLQTLSAIASTLPPQMLPNTSKPKKQDAIMQTDPVQSEEDDSQPDNSYNEPVQPFTDPLDIYQYKEKDYPQTSEKYVSKYPQSGEKYPPASDGKYLDKYPASDKYQQQSDKYQQQTDKYQQPSDKYQQQGDKYPQQSDKYQQQSDKYQNQGDKYQQQNDKYQQQNDKYQQQGEKYQQQNDKKYEMPKDFSQSKEYQKDDYSRGKDDYLPRTNEEYNKEAEKYALERKSLNGFEKPTLNYQKIQENSYKNVQDMYSFDKDYPRSEYPMYHQYTDADILRNQQHNLEMLQQQHRVTENQNFFNENHIKQEVDITHDDDKYSGMFDRAKDQIDVGMYSGQRDMVQRHLDHLQQQVKQEPDTVGCDSIMQPQGSPYYAPNGHTNSTGGYYDPLPRPGPELLIAKQNALAAHTQLWQNTMKRPFFYSEAPHYSQIHRYEDLTRILQ